jgi:hypothetical protein
MEREEGFYWIKLDGAWTIGYWYEEMKGKFEWEAGGRAVFSEPEDVNENRIKNPDE